MAKSLCLSLCFLVLFHCCLARQQQSSRGNKCEISRLNAQKPSNRIRSEAGVTEVWNYKDQQFQCAGVAVVRYTIEPRGLLLPSYSNAPQLMYFIQGRGLQGTMFSGCPETFRSFQESQQGERREQQEGGEFRGDQHQKIGEVEEGDVFVVPTGVGHFIYNNGSNRLIVVSVLDTSNDANQLGSQPRRFYLAGSPQNEFQQQQREQESSGNVFNGFDAQLLAEAFNVDVQLIQKLQGKNDKRGNIVKVEEGLQALLPQGGQEQRQDRLLLAVENSFEETLCRLRLKQNINEPRQSEAFTPLGGRSSTVAASDLPVLKNIVKMSARRIFLYKNALMLPLYNRKAHSIIYAIRGIARVEVVDCQGVSAFNEQVQQGKVLVVPQDFAVMMKAGDSGFEFIAIKTHEDAMVDTLAGQLSVIRAMPVRVIARAYQISEQQAKELKFNRIETIIAPASSRSEEACF